MHICAAERLGADFLPRRRLYQWRPAQKDGSLTTDDDHALNLAREIVSHLNLPASATLPGNAPPSPRYGVEELYGIIPSDPRLPFDIREVICRIVDGSDFQEFKARYGKTLVCAFSRINGYPVGIIANNGILFSESALKGAHFIELCTQRGIPILFLQNITGFMVGSRYEHGGIARDGAKLVNAVACAKVPKLTVIVGGSFGAGNYGMCGRAYDPRFLWMWPNARISVMGGDTAAQVLSQVRRDGMQKAGGNWPIEDEKVFREAISDQYDEQGHPFYASARLWDDGIIDPAHTRRILSLALATVHTSPFDKTEFGVFRM